MHSRTAKWALLAAAALVTPATAAALLASASAGHAADLTPQEEKLVAAARKEGAVTLINPLFSDITGQRLAEGFIKRYGLGADFKLNNLRKGTGATVAQVRQEIAAGKLTVDVHVVSAPGFFDEAARRGAFEACGAPSSGARCCPSGCSGPRRRAGA